MSIAIYPGSFDPITYGHLDIVHRATKVFDEVIVLVSINAKKKSMFSLEERKAMISEIVADIPKVRVETYPGLLVDYVNSIPKGVIVKGLRAILDFEYEFQMALVNRQLAENIETVFLMTSMKYAHVSSTLVKEILNYGGDVSAMVPKNVIEWYNRRESR